MLAACNPVPIPRQEDPRAKYTEYQSQHFPARVDEILTSSPLPAYAAQQRLEAQRRAMDIRPGIEVGRARLGNLPSSANLYNFRGSGSPITVEGRVVAGSENVLGRVEEVVIWDGIRQYQVTTQNDKEALYKALGQNVQIDGTVVAEDPERTVVSAKSVRIVPGSALGSG